MSDFLILKIHLAEINRLDIAEEKFSECEHTAIKTIQNGIHREKRIQKYEKNTSES